MCIVSYLKIYFSTLERVSALLKYLSNNRALISLNNILRFSHNKKLEIWETFTSWISVCKETNHKNWC